MSFWITIVKRPATETLRGNYKAEGFIDLPELDVMVGEHGVIQGISGFVWDPEWVQEQVGHDKFNGALNDDISGEAREVLLRIVRFALPEEAQS